MTRILPLVIFLVVGIILALSVFLPHEMISPGDLTPAHAELEQDCFACHKPFQGASAELCTACHVVADIGVRTTQGRTIRPSKARPAFHQALAETNCMACHSDHPRPRMTRTNQVAFDHALLKPAARNACQSCHQAPQDELHLARASECGTCHEPSGWTPARFDHSRFFILDRNHNVACTTCHAGADYRQYTCYGCHEHQSPRIAAEHREKGILNIQNCVLCHRSAHEEAGGGHEGRRDDSRGQ